MSSLRAKIEEHLDATGWGTGDHYWWYPRGEMAAPDDSNAYTLVDACVHQLEIERESDA